MADTFARMKQLVGTTAEWAANNIVLGEGEIGVERIGVSDHRAKCGDGVKTWSQLPYLSGTAAAVDAQVAAASAHAATATTQAGIATTKASQASASQSAAAASQSAAAASETNAANSATSAANSASAAGSASGRLVVATFAELATVFGYTSAGGRRAVAAGDLIKVIELDATYRVLTSGATSFHLNYTGSSGVKLDVLPGVDGRINILALGCPTNGVDDCLQVFQKAGSLGLSITVPSGSYKIDISSGLVASPKRALWNQVENITVFAVGATFNLIEPTISQLHADTDPTVGGFDGAVAFSFIGCKNVKFIGGNFIGQWNKIQVLDLYGNTAPRVKAVAMSGCRECQVIGVTGTGITGNLVNFRSAGSSIDGIYRRSEDCQAIDCSADYCAENGINIMGGTLNCSVIGGTFRWCQGNGVELGGFANSIIGATTFGCWNAGFGFGGRAHYVQGTVTASLSPVGEDKGFGVYITGGSGHTVRVSTRGCSREAAYVFPNLSNIDLEVIDTDSCAIGVTGGDNVIRIPTAISNSRIALSAKKTIARVNGTIVTTGTQDGRTFVTLDASASNASEVYVGMPIKFTNLAGGATGYAIVLEYNTSRIAILDRIVSGVTEGVTAYAVGSTGVRGIYVTAPTKCEIVANGIIGYASLSVLTDGTGSDSSLRGFGDAGATAGTGVTLSGYTRVGGSSIPNQLAGATISGPFRHTGSSFGVFSATAVGKRTVTGSKGANAALASLLTALSDYGLITDSST